MAWVRHDAPKCGQRVASNLVTWSPGLVWWNDVKCITWKKHLVLGPYRSFKNGQSCGRPYFCHRSRFQILADRSSPISKPWASEKTVGKDFSIINMLPTILGGAISLLFLGGLYTVDFLDEAKRLKLHRFTVHNRWPSFLGQNFRTFRLQTVARRSLCLHLWQMILGHSDYRSLSHSNRDIRPKLGTPQKPCQNQFIRNERIYTQLHHFFRSNALPWTAAFF